jgi:DNA-directed RNA polymerase III subunit RPC8
VWNSEGTELFFDKGEPVLFRVEQEEWIDQRPTIEQRDEKGEVVEERGTAWRVIVSFDNRDEQLSLLMFSKGSMNQAGLGPTLWWGEQEEEEEEGDVEMEGAEE